MANPEPIGDTNPKLSEAIACGIVMPISDMAGYPTSHWEEVLKIIKEALTEQNFDADLVSNGDEVGIIQERIVRHLAEDPIVACDVSGKNPNVMFELGMRLAFDRPTVIIKDEKTSYSFDTSTLEHLTYPSDLNYHKIQDFKTKLSSKVRLTHKKGIEDAHYSPFLKSFVQLRPKHLPTKEVEIPEVLLDLLNSMRVDISSLRRKDDEPTKKISPRRNPVARECYYIHGSNENRQRFREEVFELGIPIVAFKQRVNSDILEVETIPLSQNETSLIHALGKN